MNSDRIEELDTVPFRGQEALRLALDLLPTMAEGAKAIHDEDVVVRLARAYDRKGFETFDAVPGPRNYHGSDNDDYVVSVTFRVGQHHRDFYSALSAMDVELQREAISNEATEVATQIASLHARADELRKAQRELPKRG